MFSINWADSAVQAAVISSVGGVAAAAIAAICAGVIGAQIAGRKRLRELLLLAADDIAFLLAVEEEHCSVHSQTGGKTMKQTIRERVASKGQLSWSGKFTPGRMRDRRVRYRLSSGSK